MTGITAATALPPAKPILRKIMVPLQFWECGIARHRHRTREIAAKCIEKQEKRKSRSPQPSLAERRKRKFSIARSILNGSTLKAAGLQAGISAMRASGILDEVRREAVEVVGLPSGVSENPERYIYWYPSLRELRERADWLLGAIERMEKSA